MTYNIESISTKLIDCITDLLDEFDIQYTAYSSRVSFPCPIHDGDNKEGSSIFLKDVGNWQCFTQQCHTRYGSGSGASIIQFVQALLNSDFFTALQWCAKFVGEDSTNDNEVSVDKLMFIKMCDHLKTNLTSFRSLHDRQLLKKMLTIPSEYYIKRGYTENVLNKFDVGYCYYDKHPMFNRIVVPLFNDDGQYVIGYLGRNIYEKCDECGYCHKQNVRCPMSKEEKDSGSKWKCTYQFASDEYLYNYWNAKPHIMRENTAIVVEGPGDVWKFEEAGIYNCVGLLGAKFSLSQKRMLEKIGTINIVVATDNDDAGNNIAKIIRNEYSKSFNIFRFTPSKKDVGDMSFDELKVKIKPVLQSMEIK